MDGGKNVLNKLRIVYASLHNSHNIKDIMFCHKSCSRNLRKTVL